MWLMMFILIFAVSIYCFGFIKSCLLTWMLFCLSEMHVYAFNDGGNYLAVVAFFLLGITGIPVAMRMKRWSDGGDWQDHDLYT